MVNYVMHDDQLEGYEEKRELLKGMDIPLNPNPLFNSNGKYSKEAWELQKKYLPAADLSYKCNLLSTINKKCLYPTVAYEMKQGGEIIVGCHPSHSGSLFNTELPKLAEGIVKCPHWNCACLDKYSFLGEVNRNTNFDPFLTYCDLLREIP